MFFLMVALCEFASCALTNAESEATGRIEGTVFVMEQGHQTYTPIERISFTDPTSFNINQNETAGYMADRWALSQRLSIDIGMRLDNDTITGSTHAAPRAGFLLSLTNARLKLLESDFGCWLETVCDYLYYLLIFAGMTIGLIRTSDEKIYLTWGILLLFGAVMSFLVTGLGRHRLSTGHPEQYLRPEGIG